jgi:glycosyltransferase involved in cell wall biosynthesis
MRYVWDQRRAYFPEPRGPVGWLRERLLDRLQRWDVATAGRVDLYLANSTFVADRIRRYYGRPAEVVPPPVDTGFYRPTGSPRDGFVLMIAALAPYKKVDQAIRSCALAKVPLVVVGDGPEERRLRAMAGPDVRFTGRVERLALRELLSTALCYLQPGVEDFGISTVEALACGTPVVALGQGGVTDIVRSGEHGLLLETGEPPEVAAGIDKIRRMQFNPLDLRNRAELFSADQFRVRLEQHLSPIGPGTEGSRI